ncbi:DUF2231 domain-containing protein [Allosphingosinicella vermicomposti]|uniref:DUF2231 domain-containing protein n=1 Tax=Allosphingosinicella vermicomposti TaxID=614671 RepID=UPI001FE1BA9E|nr:DUF2231 domain-containing protein [Allosphingosinicella vermicomposti]
MLQINIKTVLAWTLAGWLVLGSAASAHENHDQLGAGPGAPAAAKFETPTADMHENMAAAHEQVAEHHEDAANQKRTFGQRIVSWLGRAHSLVVHFPIAMFIGALAVELYGLWRRDRQFQWAAHVMLVVGAIGAIAAAGLGWFAGGFYLADRNPVLMAHRWLGTTIAILGVGLLYLGASARRSPDRPRLVYWMLLAFITLGIAVQGWLGGSFMHGGMNHMAF